MLRTPPRSTEPPQSQPQALSYAAAARRYVPSPRPRQDAAQQHYRRQTPPPPPPPPSRPAAGQRYTPRKTDIWRAPDHRPATTAEKPATRTADASTVSWDCEVSPSTRLVHSGVNGHKTLPTTSQEPSGHPDNHPARRRLAATCHRTAGSTLALTGAGHLARTRETKGSNRWRCGCCTTKCRRSSAAADDDNATRPAQHDAKQTKPCRRNLADRRKPDDAAWKHHNISTQP
uniref:Tick transposon n=1 Tax=Rhipicephalus appendiculatus TaxID=34631 RepID=A0A131YJT7_RHIAP